MSVLNFTDLTDCAKKIRQPGYWHRGVIYLNGKPELQQTFIDDRSSTECRYDRKAIDSACAESGCWRIK